jgi:hypothetical protein
MSDRSPMISCRRSLGACRPLALAIALLGAAAPAAALTVNVDFGDGPVYAGTADAPDPGTVWNAHTSAGGTTPLVDSSGGATSITFTMAASLALPGLPAGNDLMVDGLHKALGLGFTIGGLLPSTQYDMYLYALGGPSAYWSFTTPVVSGATASGGALGSDVIRLESDAGGAISGTYCASICAVLALPGTGFQLSPVPEPSPGPLLLLGLAAALHRPRP